MPESPDPYEARLASLAGEVQVLGARVDSLAEQLERVVAGQSPLRTAPREYAVAYDSSDDFSPPEEVTNALKRVTAPSFLTSVAIVCLLLVIALILRTIVDTGLINQLAGALLGMTYAGLLIAFGGFRYLRERSRAAMYTTCGLVLLLAIVFETHTLFRLIPTPAAYGILSVAVIPATLLGIWCRAVSPVYVALLGASICGLAVEFPDPTYPFLGGLLAVVNGCAMAYTGTRASRPLTVSLIIVTMSFWLLWGTKVHAALSRELGTLESVYLPWALPLLCVFALGYAGMAAWPVFREGRRLGPLEWAIPTLNVFWAYCAAQIIVGSWLDRSVETGAAGAILAAGHLGFAGWVAGRGPKGAQASSSFTVAGVVLLGLSLPACMPATFWAVAIWSFVALYLCVISGIQENRPIRFVSYVLQVFAGAVAVTSGMLSASAPFMGARAGLLLLTAVFAFAHFYWSRSRGTPSSAFFFRVVSVLTLLAGTACLFGTARITLYPVLGGAGGGVSGAFVAGQSLILNGLAVAMMFLALRSKNGEFLAAAVIVALGTAMKVFGYDLLNVQALPRVMSVASSGIVAGIGSYVWGRWQQAR